MLGIALVISSYALQWLAYDAVRTSLGQSVLIVIVVPAILFLGWLASGLAFGILVISRSVGGWRFPMAFLGAAATSTFFVMAALNYFDSIPNTGRGL